MGLLRARTFARALAVFKSFWKRRWNVISVTVLLLLLNGASADLVDAERTTTAECERKGSKEEAEVLTKLEALLDVLDAFQRLVVVDHVPMHVCVVYFPPRQPLH